MATTRVEANLTSKVSSVPVVLIQGENKITNVDFYVPDEFYGADLTTANRWELHSTNLEGNTFWLVELLAEDNGDGRIHMAWLVDNNITPKDGYLYLTLNGIRDDQLLAKFVINGFYVQRVHEGGGKDANYFDTLLQEIREQVVLSQESVVESAASASEAADSATSASDSAATATSEANRAKGYADSINPAALMTKADYDADGMVLEAGGIIESIKKYGGSGGGGGSTVLDTDKEVQIGWKLVDATNRLYKAWYEWYEDVSSLPNATTTSKTFSKISGNTLTTFERGAYTSTDGGSINTGPYSPMPFVFTDVTAQIAIAGITATGYTLSTGSNRTNRSARLWFRYVKTADPTVPESQIMYQQSSTPYIEQEAEHQIGWKQIGTDQYKPLYAFRFRGTTPATVSANQNYNLPSGLENLEYIRASVTQSSGNKGPIPYISRNNATAQITYLVGGTNAYFTLYTGATVIDTELNKPFWIDFHYTKVADIAMSRNMLPAGSFPGDMLQKDYDADDTVKNAGGIMAVIQNRPTTWQLLKSGMTWGAGETQVIPNSSKYTEFAFDTTNNGRMIGVRATPTGPMSIFGNNIGSTGTYIQIGGGSASANGDSVTLTQLAYQRMTPGSAVPTPTGITVSAVYGLATT